MCESFDDSVPQQTPRLFISFDPNEQANVLENQSYFTQKLSPVSSVKKHNDKDLSVRWSHVVKKQQFFKKAVRSPSGIQHLQTDISQPARSSYEEIERILKNENSNLKQQNELLLRQINRLKHNNQNYKQNSLAQQIHIDALREECHAQKHRADQMKHIIMNRLQTLENKTLGQENQKLGDSAIGILEGLSLTESGIQKSRSN